MKMYPEVQRVKCIYSYVEHDFRNSKVFTRDDIDTIQKIFSDKIEKIEYSIIFRKNITKLCGWCDFLKQGHCTLEDNELLKII